MQLTGPTINADQTLQDLVLPVSKSHPDNIALRFDTCQDGCKVTEYTYSQLMHVVSWIQSFLIKNECCHQVIGILSQDQPLLPAWLIGILLTPAVFLPLHSDISRTRLRKLITKLQIKAVLTDVNCKQTLVCLIPELISGVYDIRDHMTDPVTEKSEDHLDLHLIVLRNTGKEPTKADHPESLAYVITTSGTTGCPKIIRVPHQCIVPNIIHLREIYNLSPSDCVYQASPLTFDPSIVEIFTTLSSGATLLSFPEDMRRHPQDLANYLSSHHVTVIQATPSLITSMGANCLTKTLLSDQSTLRVLALGGEQCPSCATLNSWRASGNYTCIINLYGITEVSSWAMYHIVTEQDQKRPEIPLGQPLYNTVISTKLCSETFEKHLNTSQLYIGGSTRLCGVGDELASSEGNTVMRATGDLVREEEGSLYYVGRIDEQIKLNGKRLNPLEIENVCEQYSGIQRAALVFDHPRLYLFVVFQDGCHIQEQREECQTRDKIELFLREHLPNYSLPSDIIVVNRIPLTRHGKANKVQLLEDLQKERLKTKLLTLWQRYTNQSSDVDVLSEARFTESGGDSLSAIRFTDAIEAKILGYNLPNNKLLDLVLTATFDCLLSCVYSELYDNRTMTLSSQIAPSSQTDMNSQSGDAGYALKDNKSRNTRHYDATYTRRHHDVLQLPTSSRREGFPDDADESIKSPVRKKLKECDLLKETCSTRSEMLVGTSSILSVSRMSQTRIYGSGSMETIDPERLVDICCPVIEMDESWRFNTGKCVDSSPLIVVERSATATIYIGSHSKQCTLVAIDLATGKKIWSESLYTRIEAAPTLSKCGQFLVVGAYDHNVYVFEAKSGVLQWKFATGDQVKDSACVDPSSGLVYIGSHDHYLYCLNIKERSCLWRVFVAGCVFASPCLYTVRSHLYVATTKGNLYCVNPDTGQILWSLDLTSPIFSSPALTPDGVCVGTVGHVMYFIGHSGEKIWSYRCDGPIFSSPSVYTTALNDTSLSTAGTRLSSFYCVFGTHSSDVICLNNDGLLIWKHRMSSPVYGSPCLTDDICPHKRALVIVCCTQGDIHVLDLDTGRVLGCYCTDGGQIFSSPVVWNNSLIVGCRDNNVYCLTLCLKFKHFR